MAKIRKMWIKKRFLDLILSGEKTLEVRVLYPNLRSIQKGEIINFNNEALVRVKDIRKYSSFEEMLLKEEASRIVPGNNREGVICGYAKTSTLVMIEINNGALSIIKF